MDIVEEIKDVLFSHIHEIAKKIFAPELAGWFFWVTGKKGRRKISISGYMTGGTIPNPANYGSDSWLVKFDVLGDFSDLSQEEIDDLSEEEKNDIVEEGLFGEIENLDVYGITFFERE